MSRGHFSRHCSPSRRSMLAYGATAATETSHVAVIITKAVFAWILGFKGETMALCLSVLKHSRVRTEVPISTVWIGYTTWHIVEPSRNFPLKSSVKSRGMLNILAPRSVSAKLRMKNSFGFRFFCKYIAMHTRRFPSEPTKETITYRESCITCVISFPIFPTLTESFVSLFKSMVKYVQETRRNVWTACYMWALSSLMLAAFASHELRAISSFEIAKTKANFLYFCNLQGINFSLTEKIFLLSRKFIFKQCYCNEK